MRTHRGRTMPGLTTPDFPKPKDDKEFEEIIRDLFAALWRDENTQIYGRSGQRQNGVDVYGRPDLGDAYYGIQCKLRNTGNLTRKEIKEEIVKARSFHNKLDTYLFATTAPRDVTIQDIIDDLSNYEQINGRFKVRIYFWEDICSLLSEYPRVTFKHYQQWFLLDGLNSQDHASISNTSAFDYDNLIPPNITRFCGRNEEIKRLNAATKAHSIVIIGGIAGIGKTYLANGYIKTTTADEHIIWLDCESDIQLEQFLTELAYTIRRRFADTSLLNIPKSTSTKYDPRIRLVVNILNKYNCMVVWDGFNPISNSSFLPIFRSCSQYLTEGKLIITTREKFEIEGIMNQPYYQTPLLGLDRQSSIELMNRSGLSEYNTNILNQVYERLAGHPKFITLLAGLAQNFPLEELLGELPYATEKIYEYLQNKIFNVLDITSKKLLESLSLLRIPFSTSVMEFIVPRPNCYTAFDHLTKRFLVSLEIDDRNCYSIHDLVKEFARNQIDQTEQSNIHGKLYLYYKQQPQIRYIDLSESIHHALSAGLSEEAADDTKLLLSVALHEGRYDLIIEFTSSLIEDEITKHWGFVYHFRGRALRFKEEYPQALEAYNLALSHTSKSYPDVTKIEIASVLVRMEDNGDGRNRQTAKNYYQDLSSSSDLNIRLPAMSALAFLELQDGNKESIKQLEDILQLAEANNLIRVVSHACYSLGEAHSTLTKDRKRAIQYLERSRTVQSSRELFGGENPEAWYSTNSLLAELYHDEKIFSKAILAYKECVSVARKIKLETRLSKSLHHLGRIQCKVEEYEEAKVNLLESLSLVEKYNIKEGAKRSIFEWLAVAFWYLGECEKGFEYSLDYIRLCDQEGVPQNPHPIIRAVDLRPGDGPTNWRKTGIHILILPPNYAMDNVMNWRNNIVRRRPDLAYIASNIFQQRDKSDNLSSSVIRKSVGRNDPCPCGSGCKYKHCCLNKPK